MDGEIASLGRTDWVGGAGHRIPDPAEATGSETEIALAFAEATRQLRNRIGLFVELPIDKLEKSKLRSRLAEIGKVADEPARQA